ncbi:efflux RND transporter periplasmic adaptor subunit [Falsiroseomonas sp.]|uniref:efflux RND transporter periplasmic adaptor subunit n=1 Tax=Falsiroseomonas sp. TaxID=2870721 RepID=UPI003F6EA260
MTPRPARRRPLLLALAALSVGAALLLAQAESPAPTAQPLPANASLVARGRIEPEGRVIALHGPFRGVLGRVLVQEGQDVAAGQIVALLDTHAVAEAQVEAARARLALAQAEEAQVAAPAKPGVILAQRALVRAREAELTLARQEHARIATLRATSIATQATLEQRQAELDRAEAALRQAEAELRALSEVREEDRRAAAARSAVQRAALAEAEAELARASIRAPFAGTVLALLRRGGESIGDEGILQMAALDRLVVVAEVEEADAPRIVPGQAARIAGRVLAAPVEGRVDSVGRLVLRQRRTSSDVLVGRDARIVEVTIRPLGPLPPVVGAEVEVRFPLAPARP